VKTRLESQFSRMNCQMFSTGLSSVRGDNYGGRFSDNYDGRYARPSGMIAGRGEAPTEERA
jgi:hypothetical protein